MEDIDTLNEEYYCSDQIHKNILEEYNDIRNNKILKKLRKQNDNKLEKQNKEEKNQENKEKQEDKQEDKH